MSPSAEGGISPFQTVQVRCIICEKEASFSRLKATLYSETKRDIDMRPATVLWSKKVSPHVDPKLFFFWQCPHCFFTSDYMFFQHPFKDSNLSTTRFRKQLLKGLTDSDIAQDVRKLLIVNPKQERSVFIAGLKLNLLACFQWELIEDVVKGECMQLASYYLRLSWMMYDLKHSLSKAPEVQQQCKNLLQALRGVWPGFKADEPAMLEQALRFYKLALVKSSAVHTILQEVNVRLIVARLHMKLGQMEEARKAIIECKARVKHYEELINKKRGDDSHFSADDLQEMEAVHGKSLALLSQVDLIYDKIELTLLDRQVKMASALLEKHANKPYEEKLKILQEAKYSSRVISKVLPKEKKKGLMNMLKSS